MSVSEIKPNYGGSRPDIPSKFFAARRSPESFDSTLEWAWDAFNEFKGRLVHGEFYKVQLTTPLIVQVCESEKFLIWLSNYVKNPNMRKEFAKELQLLVDDHMLHLQSQHLQLQSIKQGSIDREREQERKRKRDDAEFIE